MRPPERLHGTVTAFDDHKGHGRVRAEDGRELFFHCTSIAGGTRTIEPATRVSFVVAPGHHGRWEAADVRPR